MDLGFTIIDKFFKENPNFLVDHHLESYNRFVNNDIRQIITQNNPIAFNKKLQSKNGEDIPMHQCDIYIGGKQGDKIQFAKPILYEKGEKHYLYPNNARLQNLTYSFSIMVDIDCEFKINENTEPKIHTVKDVFFGNIPIMVQSDMCILNKMPSDVRFNMGECKIDPGGYFIIDGNEKTIISQERFANNILRVSKTNDENNMFIAEIRSESEDESKPVRETKVHLITYKDEEELFNEHKDDMKHIPQLVFQQIVVTIPNINMPIPLFIVFRALGVISDKDIMKMCVPDDDPRMMELLRPSIYDANKIFTQQLAIEYMAPFTKYLTEYHTWFILSDYFLPHINDLSEVKRHFTFDLIEKAHFLGFMVNRLLRVAIDLDKPTDRDSFQFKRVEPSGVLLSDLFKEFYKSQIKHIVKMMDIYHNETETTYDDDPEAFKQFCIDTIAPVLKQRITEKGIIAGFKGDWGSETYTKRIGLSQELNRLSYNTAVSLLRKCVMQMDENSVVLGPRYLHATQWGMMDPVDSDGGDVGTHKSFAICTKISTDTSKLPILQMLNMYTKKLSRIHCIEIVHTKPELLFELTKIFVNGHWKYSTHTPNELMIDLKHKRRTGNEHITIWTSISFNIRENIIYIYTDAGRVCRPLLYIDNTKNVSFDLDDEHPTWSSMLHGKPSKPSSVEYVDCTESNNSLISLNHLPSYHDTNYTHVEIHPSLILGFMGLHIIFPEHNPLPRNAFSCGQSRQAVAVYNTNYQNRMDKMGVVLNYGQIPLIKSYFLHHLNQEYIPYGVNAMVAIMCYTGYNTEDAILINRNSLQRGMFNTSYFTVYEETEDEEIGLLFSSNEEVPEYDESGIIREQILVDGKTPIMNMTIRNKTRPVFTKRDQRGYIDKTFMTTNPVGSRTAKVRICEERIPNIGDKFASRAGQKGTCGIILDECNMPFNENGIRPDLIINPHALPSRMTLGQLLECLIGKVHIEHGSYGDCTVFNKKTDLNSYASKLREYDFHSSGVEVLYNGMTGEPVQSNIFIGPTYYMRLKHMVKDKINFRERGPMTSLTRQPVQGRAKEGGLRIGEMERDGVLANGMNMFETESMMTRGDGTYIDTVTHTRKPYRLTIDNVSGFISIVNNTNTHYSPSIDGPLEIDENGIQSIPKYNKSYSTINVPYSFKLFMQEIATMNIQMRIVTSDNIQQLTNMGWTPIKTSYDTVIAEQGFTLMGKLIHDFQPNSLYVSKAKADPCSSFDYVLHLNANFNIANQSIIHHKPILDYTLFPCIFIKKLKNDLLLTSTQINPKKSITSYCKNKFNLNIYDATKVSGESYPVQTTVNYIFDHLKTGIFVRIKNNKVVNFMLLYNTEYVNTFADLLYVKNSKGEYVSVQKNKDELNKFLDSMPRKKKHKNPIYWHATNCLIRTEFHDMNPTDAYLSEMYDLFVNVCNNRIVHDCIFILNRKDFPHLHKEWKEPFVDIYGDTPIYPDYLQKQFIPILSQCTHDKYADIPIPTGDDLDLMYQNKMFATYSNTQSDKSDRVRCKNDSENIDVASLPPWNDRELKFIWRGQSTGCGVDEVTNPRIKLEQLCNNESFAHKEYMNVKITRITERIKTTRVTTTVKNVKPGQDAYNMDITALTFVPSRFIEDDAKVPMSKQVLCKFMFNVQGNSAAYRFGTLFKYGCCIVNIESPFKLWFETFLNTGYITSKNRDTINAKQFHCITVKSDFSNFEETIEWCLQNQPICEQIAKNGQDFYNKYFNQSFVFDYMADIFNGVSNRLAQDSVKFIDEKTHLSQLETLRNEYTINRNFPSFKENVLHTEECELDNTLIIVPYRDEGDQNRKQQLEQFVEHYSQHPSLRILIVEQSNDGYKFNRGALLNAGYLYASEHFTNMDTVIFHDVDIIMPSEIVNRYYGNCDKYKILHLGNLVQDTKYNPPFGRVIQFSKNTFEKINGFPNNFYGWGGEDDALAFRIHVSNATDHVYRPDKSEGKPAKELETKNDIKSTTDKEYKQSKIELYKWENICLDRYIWKINGLNSLQFKTVFHKELKPTVHHIITELTPSPPDKDLLHSIFKHPTDNDIELYQIAYKHFSFTNPLWDKLSDSSKVESMKKYIELLQQTTGDEELKPDVLLQLLFLNPTPQQEKDFITIYEKVKQTPEWSRRQIYKELLEMGYNKVDLIQPPYNVSNTPIYDEPNPSPPYKVTPEVPRFVATSPDGSPPDFALPADVSPLYRPSDYEETVPFEAKSPDGPPPFTPPYGQESTDVPAEYSPPYTVGSPQSEEKSGGNTDEVSILAFDPNVGENEEKEEEKKIIKYES
jgi:DNA-directed RNA polymerase II subunit RPB2